MSQGNPFGNKTGPWPPDQVLRFYFNSGLTYDEVAEAVFRHNKGAWKPSRAAVSNKYKAMGEPPRRASHRNLIPWRIKPEHNDDELRHMLQAESRARQGKELSEADRSLVARLHNLLFGRGQPMVVSYHPEVGFSLVIRGDYDQDIVREPRVDRYADPGISDAPRSRRRQPAETAEAHDDSAVA